MFQRIKNQQFFFIEAPDNNGYGLLYFPLAQKFCYPWKKKDLYKLQNIHEDDIKQLPEELLQAIRISSMVSGKINVETLPTIEDISRLTIIPGYNCNFNCQYCYARQTRRFSKKLDLANLYSAIDLFFSTTKCKNLTLAFTGGGEPCLEQDILFKAVEYAKQTLPPNIELTYSLTTNGSIIDSVLQDFLLQHNFSVRVSFDVIPNIQNVQRGHWELVDKNILQLLSAGIKTAIRSVLTHQSVDCLQDIVNLVEDRYYNLEYLDIEPAFDPTLSPAVLEKFLTSFRKNLFSVIFNTNRGKITVDSLILRMLRETGMLFCNGELCLLPGGGITWCHRVTPDAEYAEDFRYDNIKNGLLNINKEKFKNLCFQGSALRDACCSDCLAHWNCSGGCLLQNKLFSPEQKKIYCRFICDSLEEYLFEQQKEI